MVGEAACIGRLDIATFMKWAGALSVLKIEGGYRLVVEDESAFVSSISAMVVGLTNEPSCGDSTSSLIDEVLECSNRIASSERSDPLANFLREKISYFDGVLRPVNGHGLQRLFSPCQTAYAAEDFRKYYVVCVQEFISQLEIVLGDMGYLGCAPNTPKGRAVVVNGFYRTGSVKTFLAAMGILRASNQEYVSIPADLIVVDEVLDQINTGAYRGKWVLIKSHYWMPIRNHEDVVVLFTKRNLADVAASSVRRDPKFHLESRTFSERKKPRGLWRRIWGRDQSDQSHGGDPGTKDAAVDSWLIGMLRMHQFINEYVAPRYQMAVIDYDEFHGRERDLVEKISALMKLSVPKHKMQETLDFVSPRRAKMISDRLGFTASDPETFINALHVSPTLGRPRAGLHLLPETIVSDLKRYGNWPADV